MMPIYGMENVQNLGLHGQKYRISFVGQLEESLPKLFVFYATLHKVLFVNGSWHANCIDISGFFSLCLNAKSVGRNDCCHSAIRLV